MEKLETQDTNYVVVDCAIYGYQNGEIKVLLYPCAFEPYVGEWSLVNGFVRNNEPIRDAAERVMWSRIGIDNVYLKEVCTFSEINRVKDARIISVLHYALVRIDELHEGHLEEHGACWFSLNDLPDLMFDHNEMLDVAYLQMQKEANNELLGKELLPPFFTLLQLRSVYNCIFQQEFEPANFRKKILSLGVLKKQVFKNKTESKKGAYYYTFDPAAESRQLFSIAKSK